MESIITSLRDWLDIYFWTIVFGCGIALLLVITRYLIFWARFLNPSRIQHLPAQMPIPVDVWIAIGLITFVMCLTITASILLVRITIFHVIVAIVLDSIVIGAVFGSFLIPRRTYDVVTKQELERQNKKSTEQPQ